MTYFVIRGASRDWIRGNRAPPLPHHVRPKDDLGKQGLNPKGRTEKKKPLCIAVSFF